MEQYVENACAIYYINITFIHILWGEIPCLSHSLTLYGMPIVCHYRIHALCCIMHYYHYVALLPREIAMQTFTDVYEHRAASEPTKIHAIFRCVFFSSFLLFIWRSTANYWSNIVQGSKQVSVLYVCDRYPHSTSGIIINNNSSGIKNIQYSMRQSPFIMISWFICLLFSCRAFCIQLTHTHT